MDDVQNPILWSLDLLNLQLAMALIEKPEYQL